MKTVTEITAEKKETSEIRLAAYCRVSSGSADQRHSFAAQIQYYSDYCKQNPQCRIGIGITDEALLGGITDLLNDVIVHPVRLQATPALLLRATPCKSWKPKSGRCWSAGRSIKLSFTKI